MLFPHRQNELGVPAEPVAGRNLGVQPLELQYAVGSEARPPPHSSRPTPSCSHSQPKS